MDWLSNLDASANEKHQHSGFSDAAEELYETMVKFMRSHDVDPSDSSKIKYVITGHSRGGAVANILAAKLDDESSNRDNIYAYTFACPDTAVITSAAANQGKYKNIFNIGNVNDMVSWLPGSVCTDSGEKDGHGVNSYWTKYGRSYWYAGDKEHDNLWGDFNQILRPPTSFLQVIGSLSRINSYHLQGLYLEYLRKELGFNSCVYRNYEEATTMIKGSLEERRRLNAIKNLGNIQVMLPDDVVMLTEASIQCPVNVKIYNSDHLLVGSIMENQISDVKTDKVYLNVFEDEKYIYILDDDTYTLEMSGTDNGKMTYNVQNIGIEKGTAINSQVFENVLLTADKQFISTVKVEGNVAADVAAKGIKLYVVDADGEPEKEVDATGTETLITPTPPDTPPAEHTHV